MKKPKRKNNIRIIKDPIDPETPEVLAKSLIQIGEAMEKLTAADGLTDEAIAVLVSNMRGVNVSKTDVMVVLEGLNRLKSYYIRS